MLRNSGKLMMHLQLFFEANVFIRLLSLINTMPAEIGLRLIPGAVVDCNILVLCYTHYKRPLDWCLLYKLSCLATYLNPPIGLIAAA